MQGFNMGRYHAPSSLDTSLSTTVPAKRSRTTNTTNPKAPPTIRFEMPFAIWCSTCPSSSTSCLIGQGVRFNAQKSKVGNYFSTPVWQFRMKHTACGGWIEIRTDPKSSEYVVTEGARRRDTGDDKDVAERIGGVVVGEDEAEKERRRQDAFAAFEGKKVDKEKVKGDAKRLDELRSLKERDWKDVDAANRRLRSGFRVGRKAREKDAEGVERLKDVMGLGIDFVEEDEGDKRRAGLVEFGGFGVDASDGANATSKPLFDNANSTQITSGAGSNLKLQVLRQQLSGNTRAAMDPFASSVADNGSLNTTTTTTTSFHPIPGLKRRRTRDTDNHIEATEDLSKQSSVCIEDLAAKSRAHNRDTENVKQGSGLVEYDSD